MELQTKFCLNMVCKKRTTIKSLLYLQTYVAEVLSCFALHCSSKGGFWHKSLHHIYNHDDNGCCLTYTLTVSLNLSIMYKKFRAKPRKCS